MDITSYIMGSIAGAKSASGLKYLVVDELPETGADNTIYLVPKSTSKTNNYYDEYMYISNAWELIGDTEIDLSNYQTLLTSSNKLNADYIDDTNTTNKLTNATEKSTWNGKQDTLVSGTNIKTINNTSLLGSGNLDTEIIQYSTMPTASASNEGKIVQYTGTTDSTYTNGYFYQVVSDGEDPATYSWENIQVQDVGASSSPRYIEDENGNKLYFVYKGNTIDGPDRADTNIGNIVKLMYQDYLLGKNPAVVITEATQTKGAYESPRILTNYICTIYRKNNNSIDLVSGGISYSTFEYAGSGSGAIGSYYRFNNQRVCYRVTFTDNTFTEVSSISQSYYSYNPQGTFQIYDKSAVDTINPKNYTGYDATKTQILKNTNGTFTWQNENISTYQLSGLSEYSSSSTYAVGDYVYYNNLIYKCNTAVSVAEAFDDTKWTQKTYMEYMSDTLVGTALGGSY